MSAMEQALRLALRAVLDEADFDATWPAAVVAKRNAEALLTGRLRPEDYVAHARDAREVA